MAVAFQVPAQISKVTTMADGGIRIQIDTRELSSEEKALVFGFGNKEVWTAMAELAVQVEDLKIPEFVPEFKKDKTPAQRLRSVLYRLWEQNGKGGDFDSYYKKSLEKFINVIKDKLE